MTTKIDPSRHMEVYDTPKWENNPVEVVGVGATGSWLTLLLAKLGHQNIRVWDPDVVEGHNLANQAYGFDDIGKPKVEALASLVKAQTNVELKCRQEYFTGKEEEQLGEVVFVLTDTMKSRSEIFDALMERFDVNVMIETRMGAAACRVYFVVLDEEGAENYRDTIYPDDEAEVSACGSSISVGATAMNVASEAVWKLINYRLGEEFLPSNEILYSLRGCRTTDERNFVEREQVVTSLD